MGFVGGVRFRFVGGRFLGVLGVVGLGLYVCILRLFGGVVEVERVLLVCIFG